MLLGSHLGDKKQLWQHSGGSGTPLFALFGSILQRLMPPHLVALLGLQPVTNALNELTKTFK